MFDFHPWVAPVWQPQWLPPQSQPPQWQPQWLPPPRTVSSPVSNFNLTSVMSSVQALGLPAFW